MRGVLARVLGRTPLQGRSRAVVKTVGYRFFMVLITFAVAFVFTDSLEEALNIGIAANVLKTITYYVYERAWDRVAWGIEGTPAD
ncbi:MAG: DUF2061 domain-containing protein [Halobacteriaceae archaeon]